MYRGLIDLGCERGSLELREMVFVTSGFCGLRGYGGLLECVEFSGFGGFGCIRASLFWEGWRLEGVWEIFRRDV